MTRDYVLWVMLGLIIALLTPHIYQRVIRIKRSPLLSVPRPGLYDVARIPYLDLISSHHDTDVKILEQMQLYGFFYVTQIPDYDSFKELELLKRFFDLPPEVKHRFAVNKHNPDNKNVYRGYGPAIDEVGTQFKEVFNIGPYENDVDVEESYSNAKRISVEKNVWPVTDDEVFDKEFKETFQKGFALRKTVAESVIKCIGRALNAPELIERFEHHEFSTLGLRRYPRRRRTEGSKTISSYDGEVLTELEHVDSTVTVLSTFANPGLQALYNGVYEDVPMTGDSFIINIGTLLEDITENQIISVQHRVKDIQRERFSIPFFFNPSFDADISQSIHGKQTPAGKETPTFGEWMTQYLPAVEPILLRGNALL